MDPVLIFSNRNLLKINEDHEAILTPFKKVKSGHFYIWHPTGLRDNTDFLDRESTMYK